VSRRRAEVLGILRQRVFSGLHLGILRHHGQLPSVRQLARELGANPRVILAAYRSLEREGLVELRAR
jgi:GntR family transcriptional regulator / MocR family aminotransferase